MFGLAVTERADRLISRLARLEQSMQAARVVDVPPIGAVADAATLHVSGDSFVAIGNARIPTAAHEKSALDQLSSIARLLESGRMHALSSIKGQYVVAVWVPGRRELIAARDPVGLNPLYYRYASEELVVADTVDACDGDAPLNLSYVARFVAGRGSVNRVPTGRSSDHTRETIRDGVLELKPGHWLRWKDGSLSSGCFWTPDAVPALRLSFTEAAAGFRELVTQAVRRSIDEPARTWAHLSGGLDSSSVVSIASDGSARPLGGTITLRDSLANGDDTEFVGSVADRYGVRNVVLDDWWPWQRDGVPPPVTDRPARDYPFFARDRRVTSVITEQGGNVLLSGVGPDQYLPRTATHCGDLIRSGRLRTAAKELRAFSVGTRGSLWRDALVNGVLPVISPAAPGWLQHVRSRVPHWFTRDFRTRFDIRHLLVMSGTWHGRRGTFYRSHIVSNLNALSGRIARWLYSPGVEVRHPLMDQSLVEFCYGLPWHMKTDVYWTKPLLRTAMKGILPESIRMRAAGTLLTPRIVWAFRHEQDQLQQLLAGSVLAELGCIEPRRVQAALRSCEIFRSGEASFLYALLSMETWLSVKFGRWQPHPTPVETWR